MKVIIGSRVVMRRGIDTPIFTVTKIENGLATLGATKGTRYVAGGQVPVDSLLKPNKAQIEAQPKKDNS